MKEKLSLLRYTYKYYIQGTEEIGIDYALVYGDNPIATLLRNRNKYGVYEIEPESIENMTVGNTK